MGKRRAISRAIEKRLFQEVGSRCPLCGTDDISVLVIHHIIPFAENPSHVPAHMVVLCANCHAKADRGEVSPEVLYSVKRRLEKTVASTGVATLPQSIKAIGQGNIVAGRDIHVRGGVHVKVSKGTRKISTSVVIPGTVSEDPRRLGYLEYLIRRYKEFKKWDCDSTGQPMNYAMVRVAYEREIKYRVKETPLELFEAAVRFLQRRIANTKLGRIKLKQGGRIYSDFGTFDQSSDAGTL